LISKLAKPTINRSSKGLKGKEVEIAKLLPPIPMYLHKEVLEKFKFFSKGNNSKKTANSNVRKLYTQAIGSNIAEILKLKNNFLSELKMIDSSYFSFFFSFLFWELRVRVNVMSQCYKPSYISYMITCHIRRT